MDPTGLLDAVLAVAAYPGAAFLALAAVGHRWLGGQGLAPRPGRIPAAGLVPALSAVVATAMLPLPGSPALRLPPPNGAAGNAVAIIVLFAVAVDLGAGSRRAAMLAGAAAVPVLGLAASVETLSVLSISTAGAPGDLVARCLAAAILLLASTLTAGGRAASVVAASLALAGGSLVIPAALPGAPAAASAAACLGAVALSGVLARLRDRWTVAALTAAGGVASLAGTALALLAAHP